jgi:hypothetical protein
MSYTLILQCGCVLYVACDPKTDVPHTRVVESRGANCRSRKHDVGARVYLWEILPDRVTDTVSRDGDAITWSKNDGKV